MTLTQLDAFGLTLLIEAPVAAALGWSLKLSPWRCALAAVAGSALTHPILWAVFHAADEYFGAYGTPVLEALVIAAETLAYRALATKQWPEAALLSLLANAASWGAGELIYAL